jgi:Spy/CpxP family protein refolding chaperone
MKRRLMALGVVVTLAVWAVIVPPIPAGAGKPEPGKADPGKADPGKDEKLKGFLPMYWKNLGLTESQKQQVYKVQADYKKKLEALEQQIEQLKEARRKDLEAILTEQQKAELRKILQGKAPSP